VRRWLVAVGVVTLIAPVLSPVRAHADPFTEPGAYLVIAGVNAFESFQDTRREFDNSWGFAARGGYRANEWIALEAQLEFLSGFEVSVDLPPQGGNPSPGTVSLTADGGNGGVNAKVYAPWFGRFQPYGLVGIAGQWARLRTTYPTGWVCDPIYWYCTGTYTKLGNEGAFLAKFGGGLEAWISEDFGVVVDAAFNLPTGDLKDLRYTSLTWGGIFRF
jgi:opacity protein-like surface antigen